MGREAKSDILFPLFNVQDLGNVTALSEETLLENTSEDAQRLVQMIETMRGYRLYRSIGLYQPVFVLLNGDLRESL